jgi:lysophospholipase L1-like esterase
VAVLGNSVSTVPVKEDKNVVPYPDLLQAQLSPLGWDVLFHAVDGGTIIQIEAVARQVIETESPQVVILQAGIVDCAFRPLSPKERAWLSNLRPSFLRATVIRFIHHFRAEIIRMRGIIQFTPLLEYLGSFKRILEACYQYNCSVGVLPVFPVSQSIAQRNRLLPQEIEKYNQGMQACDPRPHYFQAPDFFDHRSIDDLMVSPESVHFNQLGHQLIAERLLVWMSPMLGNARC